MKLSLPQERLQNYVLELVRRQFPDGYNVPYELTALHERALSRLDFCFSHIHRKYYRDEDSNSAIFDHLNSDHFAVYLYFLGNTIWRETGDSELPTRLFYLNKCMHGLDLFYSVNMPDIFMLVHPLGTVIGNGVFQDFLVIYQNVTIGSDNSGRYPRLGRGTVLYAGSSVIGGCRMGDDVVVGANGFVLNCDVPDHSVVVGQFPNHRIVPSSQGVIERIFSCPMPLADHKPNVGL